MKAECTWGDGPDVLITLEGTSLVLYEKPSQLLSWQHGAVSEGSLDLTVSEAKQLCYELACAIQKCEQLDSMYADTLAHTVPYKISKDEEEFTAACQEEAEAHYLNEETQQLKKETQP